MTERTTVGTVVAAFLERASAGAAFGVISIHNMPILDAIGTRGRLRFVPSRGEAGAVNMADAHARVTGGLGIAITSTGTAAGNAAGALVEAQTAGSPVLHVTGQIPCGHLDRDRASLHEARDQLGMLSAISKAAFRVWSPETALPVLKAAVRTALTPPAGPVSVEIPIDVQAATVSWPDDLAPPSIPISVPSAAALDRLAENLGAARRPVLWLGGGARHAGPAVARLVDIGFGVVTTAQGRGILPEDHPASLGAFTIQEPMGAFFRSCDAMLVAGSRLRGNETLTYTLALPQPLYQIDADPQAENRNYPATGFVLGDSAAALEGLADRLTGRVSVDPGFAGDLATTRAAAERHLRDGLGPYAALVDALQAAAGREFLWVRDVTIANSTWGNRLLRIFGPRDGVHAVGGGIGQGTADGDRRGRRRGRAQDILPVRRRRFAAMPRRAGDCRAGAGRHRAAGDEQPRLRGHQEHPGCPIRGAAPLRECGMPGPRFDQCCHGNRPHPAGEPRCCAVGAGAGDRGTGSDDDRG